MNGHHGLAITSFSTFGYQKVDDVAIGQLPLSRALALRRQGVVRCLVSRPHNTPLPVEELQYMLASLPKPAARANDPLKKFFWFRRAVSAPKGAGE
ncbi:hypothetical protein QW131_26280 [Roseibium salinum]|nr:hypothetical protein [Roseibium salinum]